MKQKYINLIGKKFGRLMVIEKSLNINHRITWRCLCNCGKEKIVTTKNLRNGFTKSCGCLRSETIHNRWFVDLTGKRFGKLTVIHRDNNIGESATWRCKCDCGNEKVILGYSLKSGMTKSCGCSKSEFIRQSARKKPYWWTYYKLKFVANRSEKIFDISFQDFLEFTKTKKCYYCNQPVIWNEHFNKEILHSGYNIDRKNNNVGYIKENCVVCCPICNHIKGNLLTEEEMLKLGKIIGEIQQDRLSKTTTKI